jgi:hypothetical protein
MAKILYKYHCRMCERKLVERTPDGLCMMCHLALCQEDADRCSRCQNICDIFSDIIKREDEDGDG